MQLIKKIHVNKAVDATLLQHNKLVTTIAEQYKASGTKIVETTPYLLLFSLIILVILEQFFILLKRI